MAKVKKAGVLPVLARVNGLTKVELEKGRFVRDALYAKAQTTQASPRPGRG